MIVLNYKMLHGFKIQILSMKGKLSSGACFGATLPSGNRSKTNGKRLMAAIG
jgi:hypothetical protein